MSATILAPIALSETVKVGRRRFWKQVLPVTSINYDGQKIDFDPQFHMDLADAFAKGAYDQVPLVFAGEKNDHNMDPRNFGGDIVKVEYRGPGKNQGTWALIEADKTAARVIKNNPKLGVSARIKQGIEKADGRFFKRAVNHVLLTMNPRVQGMSPWQAVDLSEDADVEVVDLTAEHYTEGNATMKTKTRRGSRQSSHKIDLSALSDDQFNDLVIDLASMAPERDLQDLEDPDVDDPEDEGDDEGDEDEPEQPTSRKKKSKVKTTKTVERESEDDDENPDQDPDADLSEGERSFRTQFAKMRRQTAEREWGQVRAAYQNAGVPPYLLDLAEPILSNPDDVTLDLSEDEDLDVKGTIVEMLDGVKHIVDLSGEIGHQVDTDLSEEEKSESDALLDQWDETYPVA